VLVLVHCQDRPGGLPLRLATRPEHLEYMIAARDRLVFGGPLLSPDGDPVGSVFALRVDSLADADAFLAAEPYHRAGLFAEVRVQPMRQMMPEDPPGVLDRELAGELARRSRPAVPAD
jgi:uncharacterized protein YciI